MHDGDIAATAVTRPDPLPSPIETKADRLATVERRDGRVAETERAIAGATGR